MALPAFTDLITLSSSNNGLTPESMDERILTCLAILASGKNPDGTASTGQQQAVTLGDGTTAGNSTVTLDPNGAVGNGAYIIYQQAGTNRWWIYEPASDANLYFRDMTDAVQILTLSPGAGVNGKIIAGCVFMPVQATTAAAPTYVRGGVYFDTTLNKLRIGGATAWETVTSA